PAPSSLTAASVKSWSLSSEAQPVTRPSSSATRQSHPFCASVYSIHRGSSCDSPNTARLRRSRSAKTASTSSAVASRTGTASRYPRKALSARRARAAVAARANQSGDLVSRDRPAEVVALSEVAAERLQVRPGRGGLHALGNDLEAEIAGELDRRPDDRGIV